MATPTYHSIAFYCRSFRLCSADQPRLVRLDLDRIAKAPGRVCSARRRRFTRAVKGA